MASLNADTFLKKKWERVFYTFFDKNKNKYIDWNDFEVLFDKIKDLRGADSQEYRIVSDAMQIVWRGLLCSTKGSGVLFAKIDLDQRISIDEWNTFWATYNPKHMDIWLWEYLKYMFFLIDMTGDKVIDKDEYRQVMKMYGMDPKTAEDAFEKFAVDDEGQKVKTVNYGQFVRLWTQYFCSKDPNSSGSYLFGTW